MSHISYSQLFVCIVTFLGALGSVAQADNGTVVSGTVIGIDPVNQIMRVHVTAVNGQFVFGNPLTNFVDYLVSPATVVVDSNNMFVGQANIFIGSQVSLEFAGPLATTIVINRNIAGWGGPASSYAYQNQPGNRACNHSSHSHHFQNHQSRYNQAPAVPNHVEPSHHSQRPGSSYTPRGTLNHRPSSVWVR